MEVSIENAFHNIIHYLHAYSWLDCSDIFQFDGF
jgi:hypothetical protein